MVDIPPRNCRATFSKPYSSLSSSWNISRKKHRLEMLVDRERQTWILFGLPCKLVFDLGWNIFGIFTNNTPRLSIKALNHIVKEPSPEGRSS